MHMLCNNFYQLGVIINQVFNVIKCYYVHWRSCRKSCFLIIGRGDLVDVRFAVIELIEITGGYY